MTFKLTLVTYMHVCCVSQDIIKMPLRKTDDFDIILLEIC